MTQLFPRIMESGADVFDWLHHRWDRESTQRILVTAMAFCFLGVLAAVEADRLGLLPAHLSRIVPDNPFYAVNAAFTLLLVLEVAGMIFVLPCSFSRSMGKQFEILSLILLRNAFKELVNLQELVSMPQHLDIILRILCDGFGALAVFLMLLYYRRITENRDRVRNGAALYSFVVAKKVLALILLGTFTGLGLFNAWQMAMGRELVHFFLVFYTVLIFSDIFVVIIAQRFLHSFEAVFRNSGLALATLLIRLALASPPYWNTALGVCAAVFAVCLGLIYKMFHVRADI
ncbi:hypothetical protein [Desulfocurvus sp. DL9XJH121]